MTISGSGIAGGARPDYYDRAPSNNFQSFETGLEGPHGATTRGTYTVPTGRSAYLEYFDIAVVRATAASTPGQAGVMLRITDIDDASFNIVSAALLSISQNSINDARYSHGGLTMLLRAGDIFTYQTFSDGSGGTVWNKGTAKICEFTA